MSITRRSVLFWMTPLLATGFVGRRPAWAATSDLRIAYPNDIPNWDPESQTAGPAMSILNCVFDTPIGQKPDMTLLPRIFTEWKWSDDRMALHAKVRQGVVFHSGDPLTADDVKFTFDRYKKEALAQSSTYKRVKEITVGSDSEITFKLAEPFATLPARLSIFGTGVLPKAYVEKVGITGFMEHPVGSGPYKLISYNRDSRVVLEAFDKYWGGVAPIKNVTFEIVKDPTARVAAIEAGRADLTLDVPIRSVSHLSQVAGLKAEILPYPAQLQMLQVTDRGAFKDKNVRLAVHHAIDKAALSKAFYGGKAVPISVLSPPGFPGDVPNFKFEYSVDKAKELLAASGYSPSHPAKIDFMTTNGVYANDFDVARAIVQMLKKVGVDANLEVIELSKYYELNRANKLPEMTLFHWSNPTGDPEVYPGGVLDSNRPFSAWKGKEAGDTIAKLFAETDEKKRIEGYVALNRRAVEQGWTIPLLQPAMTIVYKKDLDFTLYETGWLTVNSIKWK
jgi:peptide/nickel transport system substrate-binding protein